MDEKSTIAIMASILLANRINLSRQATPQDSEVDVAIDAAKSIFDRTGLKVSQAPKPLFES